MSEDTPEQKPQAPQMAVLAQFLRDLSFENPNPLVMLQQEERPSINVDVDVQAHRIAEEQFEVQLVTSVKAQKANSEDIAFLVESVYSGVFLVRNVPDAHIEGFLTVECARLLFPFARNIIADATRDGGFPPLMLDPIDFLALFQKKQQARMDAAAAEAPASGTA